MAKSDFDIKITKDAVDVRYTPSVSEPHGKLTGFVLIVVVQIVTVCALLFLPGKHGGSSVWHDLSDPPFDLSGFLAIVIFMAVFIGLLGWQSFRYARAAWASDEILHCDRDAITVSRIPWLDFHNRTWRTHRYPLAEVEHIRFAVIASARGRAFFGLRFRSHGRKWVLPGLEAPEAKVILTALKDLGADVPEDPKLEKRIKEAQSMRFGDTSWLDRSWMDHDSKP